MAALGRSISGVDQVAAMERRHDYVCALAGFHGRYDLLLTPTLAKPPLRVGALDTPWITSALADVLLRTKTAGLLRHAGIVDDVIQQNLEWVPFTQLANITGRPAMSVPLHWTTDGLPLGVQLVAGLGGEALLLRLASQLEAARPWAGRHPAL
jgi:Asp-tRNA(Asn)/Glu-tRNA(Gln) amidotransferase A subunit family amidase